MVAFSAAEFLRLCKASLYCLAPLGLKAAPRFARLSRSAPSALRRRGCGACTLGAGARLPRLIRLGGLPAPLCLRRFACSALKGMRARLRGSRLARVAMPGGGPCCGLAPARPFGAPVARAAFPPRLARFALGRAARPAALRRCALPLPACGLALRALGCARARPCACGCRLCAGPPLGGLRACGPWRRGRPRSSRRGPRSRSLRSRVFLGLSAPGGALPRAVFGRSARLPPAAASAAGPFGLCRHTKKCCSVGFLLSAATATKCNRGGCCGASPPAKTEQKIFILFNSRFNTICRSPRGNSCY